MTIEALKKRIKTTEDLREIVNTMKALSSVSILQYEQANGALEKYRHNLKDAFQALVLNNGLPSVAHNKTQKQRYLVILIGTDSGMVGKFNKELLDKVRADLKKHNVLWRDVLFLTIGKRITMLAEQAKCRLFAKYAVANSVKMVGSISETVIMKLEEATRKEQINNVSVWYHIRNKNSGTMVEKKNIVPFDMEALKNLRDKPWGTNNIPMIPMEKEKLFSALVNEFLMIAMASFLNSSLAAEHYTRMTNMQNAEKNIDESLEDMNLQYQQQRQESITDELIDVISGAEAMK
jgi:F-type H+-transporting ATPase subunit gamma